MIIEELVDKCYKKHNNVIYHAHDIENNFFTNSIKVLYPSVIFQNNLDKVQCCCAIFDYKDVFIDDKAIKELANYMDECHCFFLIVRAERITTQLLSLSEIFKIPCVGIYPLGENGNGKHYVLGFKKIKEGRSISSLINELTLTKFANKNLVSDLDAIKGQLICEIREKEELLHQKSKLQKEIESLNFEVSTLSKYREDMEKVFFVRLYRLFRN